MRIGLEFAKTGMVKYISHLDLQRAFSRAIRRSGLPVRLSQGFNPHYVVSFASALALGVESECECVEMALSEEMDATDFLRRIAPALPPGIEARRAMRLKDGGHKLMAAMRETEYRIDLRNMDMDEINRAVCDIMNEDEISATKHAKGKDKTFNMREMILDMKVSGDALVMRLAAGSSGSLKPDFVIEEIRRRAGGFDYSAVRTGLFAHSAGQAAGLLETCGG